MGMATVEASSPNCLFSIGLVRWEGIGTCKVFPAAESLFTFAFKGQYAAGLSQVNGA